MQKEIIAQLPIFMGLSEKEIAEIASNVPFAQQLQTNGRTQVGLSLNIPIFNGMQTKYRVKMTELGIDNQQLNIENTSKKLKKEIARLQKLVDSYEERLKQIHVLSEV